MLDYKQLLIENEELIKRCLDGDKRVSLADLMLARTILKDCYIDALETLNAKVNSELVGQSKRKG